MTQRGRPVTARESRLSAGQGGVSRGNVPRGRAKYATTATKSAVEGELADAAYGNVEYGKEKAATGVANQDADPGMWAAHTYEVRAGSSLVGKASLQLRDADGKRRRDPGEGRADADERDATRWQVRAD